MGMEQDYKAYAQRREEMATTHFGPLWLNQEKRYVHPFRIFGNIWYVGDSWVCVHLIDTGDGLLLIDSGNAGATALLVQAIWEAGFNPADVKWIIHSHGHLDHSGGANFFKRMFGTKLSLGEPDAIMFREKPWISAIQNAYNDCDALFTPDYEIKEGDVLTFGNTTMEFYLVPGHTDGCVAIFFDAHEGDKTVRCGYFGGFGFNTMQKDYLIEIGDPEYKTREIYLQSLAKVRNQKVELFLGNHCINNDTLGRRQRQLDHPDGPNPFLDSELWGQYLDQKRDEMLAFMHDPKNI